MKYCPSCRISVGGGFGHCPLCQNELQGEGESNAFPFSAKLNKQSFLYKLQLFISLSVLVVSVFLDFLLELRGEKHWSLVVVVWMLGIQLIIKDLLRKHITHSRLTSCIGVGGGLILAYTFWFFGELDLFLIWVFPALCGISLILHFVFSMTDKGRNALVYFLVNILVEAAGYGAVAAYHRGLSLMWNICFMVTVILIIGMVIFGGRKMFMEIQKRLNF